MTTNTDSINNETFTAEWALSETVIPAKPGFGSPASAHADFNSAISVAGRKRARRQELGIGEFARE